MKSAYELAMERLEKNAPPSAKLTEAQKAAIAAIESKFTARIAEREIFLGSLLAKARAAGKAEDVEQLEKQLASERRRLRDDCEAEKEKARAQR